MQYLVSAISLIAIFWFWSWFLNQVFSRLKVEGVSKWWFVFWGFLLVFLLFMYEKLLVFLGLDLAQFSLKEEINFRSLGVFLVYLLLALLLILFLTRTGKKKEIWIQLLLGFFTLIGLVIGGKILGAASLAAYYMLTSSSEELLKFSLGNSKTRSLSVSGVSSLLLFSLLIAFSFSLVENFLAFGIQLLQKGGLETGILFGRGLVSSLVHVVATGSIALVIMNFPRGSLFLKYFIALLLGFALHTVFNLSLAFGL